MSIYYHYNSLIYITLINRKITKLEKSGAMDLLLEMQDIKSGVIFDFR